MSDTSSESGEDDCPLCVLPLDSFDRSHPLQCPSRHCRFNCCVDCLERMIQSTKEDGKASDGNSFRVFLHCPGCRSNLGPSIRDTLLLRKADKYSNRAADDDMQEMDERLSASELSLKYAFTKDEDVACAIEEARNREDDFFGRGAEINAESFDGLDAVMGRSFMELCEDDGTKQLKHVQADPTLLCGLDAFMTVQEQKFITAQLISGDTSKLASATEMMHHISTLYRQGIKPSSKRRRNSILDSIKEIIREGNEARMLEAEKEALRALNDEKPQKDKSSRNVKFGYLPGSRSNRSKQVDMEMKIEYMELKKQMMYMKLHPLPLRMPKYAEVVVSKDGSMGLAFWDDTWDGTVLDAFSKIEVNQSFLGQTYLTKQHADSKGIRDVLDVGSPRPNGKGYIDTEKPRVVIVSINGSLGQQGIVKGDVVSHFNGEPYLGTARELMKLIENGYKGEVMTIAFNADSAVAEALKRRSMLTRKKKESSLSRRPRPSLARRIHTT
mmetsp:Transcript_11785/g.25093  ORF Transcript_11785/g.25093 Transcript_11785/m.25093 type:complete len:498 (+) Transcript_11785:79-1572(+)